LKKLVLLCLAALAAGSARAEPVTIKLGTLAPTGSPWHDALKELAERWAEASGGQVRLRVYPGGVQGSEGDMVRKLGVGQLQAVAITNVGLHDVVPEAEAFTAPLLFRDEAELLCAFDQVKGRVEAALAQRNLVALQWTRVGTASFFCRQPYRTPEEMGKAKVFAWEGDPATVKAWRTAGLEPVVLSSTDLLPALSTGMIDCVSNVPLYMLSTRAFERARYLVDLPLGFLTGATVVRKDVWDRISPDLQGRLLAIAREVSGRIDADAHRLEADAVSAMKGQGLQVIEVDPEAWRPALERSWAAIRGGAVPADFFDTVEAARDRCASGAPGARARRGAAGAPRPPKPSAPSSRPSPGG
jgi:TRAP-type C4-dicarboxylate transport system substrate-binding protein